MVVIEVIMFGLFKKDPVAELEKKYAKMMEDAMKRQQNGDIEGYAQLTFKADEMLKEIDELKKKK